MPLSQTRKIIIGTIIGVSAFCALFLWQGVETVGSLLAQGGLALMLVCLFSPVEQWLASEGWRVLFPRGRRPTTMRIFLASWMGSAVNTLLPVATIGGELAKTRILIRNGQPTGPTVAIMFVDKTAQAFAVALWGVFGVLMLAVNVGDIVVASSAFLGACLLLLGIIIFALLQKQGVLGTLASRILEHLGLDRELRWRGRLESMDDAFRELYQDRFRLIAAVSWRIVQRVFLVGEVVLVGFLVGLPIGLVEAVILKGIIGALRGASFAVPGGVGIQEGGYVAIGALLGHPADLMLVVSLATRIREILPSIPMLILWQMTEARKLLGIDRSEASKDAL